jgi:invasion protein IalB
VKLSLKLAILVLAMAFGSTGSSYAQRASKSNDSLHPEQTTATPLSPQANSASANTPAPPGWAARCSSASRNALLERAMEQTAVLSKTGQLVVLINIRVPTDTHARAALVQLPLGLNLPDGAKLQVDDGKATNLPI